MIISASRRTDIPAFYAEWFMNRIREGFLYTRNPFNAHQIKKVSLLPQDVEAIVFWTRNPEKLIPYLDELHEKQYNYYFQYTITGYPRTLEKSVPNPTRSIDTFIKLSDKIGSGKVIWRYDPILLSNYVGIDDHKRLFSKIAQSLEGKTKRVVISFADLYKKTERNLKAVEGLFYNDITANNDAILDLSEFMVKTALQHGMSIKSCAEEIDLLNVGIEHGKCIDEEILKSEFELSLNPKKDKGQREACGCIKSIDIGEYNTCLHGCSYCYATFNEKTVIKNKKQHDPNSPFLIGSSYETEKLLLPIDTVEQLSLF
ncbi:MAG: DUF1848 domain-containing protein [Methylococcales bacterium]|nr:DUF1848 domain-containing protein [Methylococcales bacterium]